MLKNRNLFLFIIASIFSFLLVLITNHLIRTTELFYNSYMENFSLEQTKEIIKAKEKWKWIGYIVIPLSILEILDKIL